MIGDQVMVRKYPYFQSWIKILDDAAYMRDFIYVISEYIIRSQPFKKFLLLLKLHQLSVDLCHVIEISQP